VTPSASVCTLVTLFSGLLDSLAGIAKRRPSMFGRILPVLLSLAPDCEPIKGGQVASVIHALKTAFLSLLKCSQPAALPV